MTKKMISDLPKDLIEEILSRLSLKSMRSMRLTCKKWNALSKSQSFLKMHLAKQSEAGEYRRVMIKEHTLYLLNVIVDEDPSKDPRFKLSRLNQQAMKISQVFHCEVLLLCILKESTRFVVWNPYLGQTRWIEPRYSYRGRLNTDRYRYALGYLVDNNNKKKTSYRSHKILRFLDEHVSPLGNKYASEKRFVWYEIYDFDSDLWTTLDVPTHWYITFYQHGVSLKGNTYWCATKRNSEAQDGHLICFDFTRGKFGPLMRLPFSDMYDDYVTLSCVSEDKLAVLLSHGETNPYELDIWITTKIETKQVYWIKFLKLYTEPEYPITMDCFFIVEEKKIAMGFDDGSNWDHHILSIVGEDGYSRKLDFGERVDNQDRMVELCFYVPSLVQIKQLVVGKRKRLNISEKRRYDEKMTTLDQLQKPIVKKQSKGSSKRRK